MAEISAQDLRRLRALEGRLEKAEGEKRTLGAERRTLRARATAAERAVKAAERGRTEVETRVTALLEENAALAARLEDIAADGERLRAAAEKLRGELDTSKAALRETNATAKRLQSSLQKTERERDRLDERLKLAEGQLKGKTTAPLLAPTEVAGLLDGFVEQIAGGLPGLEVREGEVKLQVGFGKVGRASGFVVPTADAPPEARRNLHEIALRFDRTLASEELETKASP